MDVDKLSADELDEAFRLLSRPFNLHRAFARPPPGDIPTTIFQPLTSSAPVSKLGQLGQLPLELMANVCLGLDIASAFSFSQVSRHAREAIASVSGFRLVGRHVAGCLWVFLNTKVASHVDMVDLFSALTTSSCSFCGHFGDLLSIPTVQRCCLRCFTNEAKLQPSFLSELTRGVIGIPSANIIKRDFPVLRTIPDSYGWSHTLFQRRRYIVAGQHARELQQGPYHYLPPSRHSYILSFTTFTILPYLNPVTEQLQDGFTCRGCRMHASSTREGFVSHLQSCVGAANRWRWFSNNRT
ncbi:hypothetical protein FJTKL_12633 [Diaporthe vaccinii]|uniref:F-box domain-containing protein n=1 Tax=Diaporthe vaccinii TaxID=105482 RepID=A0ABR4ED77_9PEZI